MCVKASACLTAWRSPAPHSAVRCIALLDDLIITESNLSDLGVKRLKPFDEQAVRHDGCSGRRLRLAIGERVAHSPNLMNDPVPPPIKLRQLI